MAFAYHELESRDETKIPVSPSIVGSARNWLEHPLARNLDLDDPRTTLIRQKIINQKPFVKLVYRDWYQQILRQLTSSSLPILEIGSGSGFLREHIPGLVTSDLFTLPWLSVVLNGHHLPFKDQSLRAIILVNVLHHLSNVPTFLSEASRTVSKDGVLLMLEPWVSPWSRFVYSRLHREQFEPDANQWYLAADTPLSSANGAIPWIIFHRDKERFIADNPSWNIENIQLLTPFTYLISGGVSLRSLAHPCTYPIFKLIEDLLKPFYRHLAMFALICLRKSSTDAKAENQYSMV